jgi:hypothetical protein
MAITLKANGSILFTELSSDRYPFLAVGSDLNPYRNRISNGNMFHSQRTVDTVTTHPGIESVDKHFAADRFRVYVSDIGDGNGINYRRVHGTTSVTPEGHDDYIRITTLMTTTPATTDIYMINTAIEGFDFYDSHFGSPYGVPFVLSFWVRTSVAGNYCISFRNDNYWVGNRSYVTHYNIASANTWTKVYIPLPPCGDGDWGLDNAFGLYISWTLACGSSYVVPSGSESTWVIAQGYPSSTSQYYANPHQTNFMGQASGQTFDLTGVCLERAPQSALSAYVLRNTSITSNGTTGLTLIRSGDDDDTFFTISPSSLAPLPFSIKMFGKTTDTIYVSTNGYLGIDPAGTWGGVVQQLIPTNPSVEHVGFFKGDKRLLTLYGGSRTISQPDGSSLSAYVLRWEGYNYQGNSANRTIVEFTFYADTETYEGFNFFDVLYTTNANGTTYVELNPGTNNSAATAYPYARAINPSTLGYRCYTKAFTDVQPLAGVWWNYAPTTWYNYSLTSFSLYDDIQYKLGVSSGTSKGDSGIDLQRCLRYFEKTSDETYVIPALGNATAVSGTNLNYGIYSRFKSACSTTSYIPILYSVKRVSPTITLFSIGGSRGYVTLDNGGQAVTGYAFNTTEKSSLTRVDYNTGISHYGYYATAAIDSDL